MCPPFTSNLPSDKNVCPPQKIQSGLGTAVKTLLPGSHTYGCPNFPQLSTFPFRSRCRCSPMMGQENGAVHFPTVPSLPAARTDADPIGEPQGTDWLGRRATRTSSW